MNVHDHSWVVVLAGGDGQRLSSLTTDSRGRVVPKQYCSLIGGDALIREAITRGCKVVPRERVCALVAMQHRRFWWSLSADLPPENLIAQPRNCGTAIGILLAVLKILRRDPFAHILFIPADHHFDDEGALADTLREVLATAANDALDLFLVGVEPDCADSDLGYIVQGAHLRDRLYEVRQFVEKPKESVARELCDRGALWNTFLFCAWGLTALTLIREHLPTAVDAMSVAIAQDETAHARDEALTDLYRSLPTVDFSQTVLQRALPALRVIQARQCGWTDLGTPGRVAHTLERQIVHRGKSRAPLDLCSASAKENQRSTL